MEGVEGTGEAAAPGRAEECKASAPLKKCSTCPTCGAIWLPTVAEKIAAKSNEPVCWVCAWIASPEGQQEIRNESRPVSVTLFEKRVG